jgi:hypothetical protein
MGVDQRNHIFAPELSPGWPEAGECARCSAVVQAWITRNDAIDEVSEIEVIYRHVIEGEADSTYSEH